MVGDRLGMVHDTGLPKYVISMCAPDALHEALLISVIVERR